MLTQSRSRGICQGCRYDLQVLFERGFSSTTSAAKRRRIQPGQHQTIKRTSRSFIATPRVFIESSSRRYKPLSEQPDSYNLGDEDTVVVSQLAAVEALERELENSSEDAIVDADVPAELISAYGNGEEVVYQRSNEPMGDIPGLDGLRTSGASPADVARAARQIHGDVLPDDILNDEELSSYRRLYGEPAREPEEMEYEEVVGQDQTSQNQLLSAEGEEIDFRPYSQEMEKLSSGDANVTLARSRVTKLAETLGGSVVEDEEYNDVMEEEEDDDEESSSMEKGHPLTVLGKFRTNPRTVFLSQEGFNRPVEKIMSKYSNKHLKEMCERTFGGPGLPDSPLTPRSARTRQKVPIPLTVTQNIMGEMEANAFVAAVMPPTYASIKSVLVETRKRLGSSWLDNLLARDGGPRVLDAGAGGVGIVAWRDIVQAHWESLHSSDRKAPSPPATKSVVLTGSDGLRHRAAALLENTTFIPRLPDYVHSRDAPTFEDNRPSQKRKQFDVIIASHTVFPLSEDFMRKQHVQNLWAMLSDEGGILILIEKGVSRGFEAVAGAREMLLKRYIAVPDGYVTQYSQDAALDINDQMLHQKQTAMIVAPCTNHEQCPMYAVPGTSRGRRDICTFQQRYIRPQFLQRVLGARDRNHDDVDFSYLSVMKGDDIRLRDITSWSHVLDPLSAPLHPNLSELAQSHENLIRESKDGFESVEPEMDELSEESVLTTTNTNQLPTFQQMPRVVYPPLKRRGHVSIDLCTPTGKIERWTIPRSFSRQAYRDARKSKWGDIWALGAKTHIARNLKVGTASKDTIKDRLKSKALKRLEERDEERMEDLMEEQDLMTAWDEEIEADLGTLRNVGHRKYSDGEKPMNNRERKAAKKAAREPKGRPSSTSHIEKGGDADLSFKPRRPPQEPATMMDEILMKHAASEWAAELDRSASLGKGKKGSALGKFGSSSKAAKEMQKQKGKVDWS